MDHFTNSNWMNEVAGRGVSRFILCCKSWGFMLWYGSITWTMLLPRTTCKVVFKKISLNTVHQLTGNVTMVGWKLTTMPILLDSDPEVSSTASPKTMFINWSYPRRVPLTFLPLFRCKEMVLSRYDLHVRQFNWNSEVYSTESHTQKDTAGLYLRLGPLDPMVSEWNCPIQFERVALMMETPSKPS